MIKIFLKNLLVISLIFIVILGFPFICGHLGNIWFGYYGQVFGVLIGIIIGASIFITIISQ
jgi:hypothetical protein